MCFGPKYCAWDLSLKLFSAIVVITGSQYALVSCFLVCFKWEKNPKLLKISVFKRSGLEKLYMLTHDALNAVLVRISFSPLHVTLYTVFSFNVLVVRSIFFSHRVLQQWKIRWFKRDSSSLEWRFDFANKKGSHCSCRTGLLVPNEPKPLMAVVFLERKGSEETGFSLCPVIEACVLCKILKSLR